jgi:hypothetical protein
MSMIAQVVRELAYRHPVRCWPWERVTFTTDESFRSEPHSDEITIRGDLFGWGKSLHAIATIDGRRAYALARGQKAQFIEAVDNAIAEVAEMLHTRPAYTPPPKGWRKFGRVRR